MAEFTQLIPPGQEGKVTLNVDGSKITKSFLKTATIYSNDTANPEFKIEIKGSIKKYILIEPGELVNLDGFENEEVKKVITIRAHEENPFMVEKIDTNLGEKIKTNLKTVKENLLYELEIIKPSTINENFNGSITITTNLEKIKTASIQVRGSVRSDVKVTPSMINFGNIDISKGETPEHLLKRIAILEKVKGEGLQIKAIKFNTEMAKAQVETLTEGKRYKINVILDRQSLKNGRFNNEMTIETNYEKNPFLKVRLIGNVL